MAQPTYKPLLFTTTIRNPERFKDFMHILFKYNGQLLTEDIVEAVEKDIFTVGLYRPMKRIPLSVKEKWKSTCTGEFAEEALTPQEAKAVYDNNDPQKWDDIKGHKEAGFAKDPESMSRKELEKLIAKVEKQMRKAAAELDFENAAVLRDKMAELRKNLEEVKGSVKTLG